MSLRIKELVHGLEPDKVHDMLKGPEDGRRLDDMGGASSAALQLRACHLTKLSTFHLRSDNSALNSNNESEPQCSQDRVPLRPKMKVSVTYIFEALANHFLRTLIVLNGTRLQYEKPQYSYPRRTDAQHIYHLRNSASHDAAEKI